MANVTFPVSLQYSSNTRLNKQWKAAAALPAGRIPYLNSVRKLAAAQANGATTDEVAGVAIVEADAADQPLIIAEDGTLTNLGSILSVGRLYFLSDSGAGLAMPYADLTSGDYVALLGVGIAADQLRLQIHNSGVQIGTPPTGNVTLATTLLANSGAKIANHYIAGAAIPAGRVVYLNTSNRLAQAQANAAGTAAVLGITLAEAGGAEQAIPIITEGLLTGLSGLITGVTYCLSAATAGTLIPAGDLTGTNRVSIVGIALSTSTLYVKILNSGVAWA